METFKKLIRQLKEKMEKHSGVIFLSLLFIIMISYKMYENKGIEISNSNNNNMTTYEYNHTIINDKDKKKEIVSNISNKLRQIRSGSTYVQIQTGDNDYESYMYNRNNECLAQTSDESYYAVFRKDNKTIKYSTENNMIALGTDMDIMTFAINAIESVVKESSANITLLDMELSDNESGNNKEFRVDINGEEAVKLCYNSLGENFANNMIDKLKEQMGNDWVPRLVMIYNISDNEDIGVSCCYVVDNTEYLSWVMEGYTTVGDWALDSKWYTANFEDLEELELSDMLESLLDDAYAILDRYINENLTTTTSETPNNTGDNEELDEIQLEVN